MISYIDTLRALQSGDFSCLYKNANEASSSIIQNKINEIPSEYFEPRISINKNDNTRISLIQFSIETANMDTVRRKGLMTKYNIDPHDMKKLQTIVDSINIAREYGEVQEPTIEEKENRVYGISLSSNENLDKAYPLWVAYLLSDSKKPLSDAKAKLREDGVEDKYSPEMIVDLIKHTKTLMKGKSEEEIKDFYVQSINGILDNESNNDIDDKKIEIEL